MTLGWTIIIKVADLHHHYQILMIIIIVTEVILHNKMDNMVIMFETLLKGNAEMKLVTLLQIVLLTYYYCETQIMQV